MVAKCTQFLPLNNSRLVSNLIGTLLLTSKSPPTTDKKAKKNRGYPMWISLYLRHKDMNLFIISVTVERKHYH